MTNNVTNTTKSNSQIFEKFHTDPKSPENQKQSNQETQKNKVHSDNQQTPTLYN